MTCSDLDPTVIRSDDGRNRSVPSFGLIKVGTGQSPTLFGLPVSSEQNY